MTNEVNYKILKEITQILSDVHLDNTVKTMLLNPLTAHINDDYAQSTINHDIRRIRATVGGLLKVQYTDDIRVLLPYCLNIIKHANHESNYCLLDPAYHKHQPMMSGMRYCDFISDVNTNAADNINTMLMNVAKHQDTTEAKAEVPALYSKNNVIRNLYYTGIKTHHKNKIALTDLKTDRLNYLLIRVNQIFNQYLIQTGLIKIKNGQTKPTCVGLQFMMIDPNQFADYFKHYHFNFKSELPWPDIIAKLQDTFNLVHKYYAPSDNNYGLATALTISNYKVLHQAITCADNDFCIPLTPFMYLSYVLTIFSNIFYPRFTFKPNQAVVDLITNLRGLSPDIVRFSRHLKYR